MKTKTYITANGYLTGMNADERRYDKTGTLSRLTTNGDLALIKADEIGCGQNETSFGFICVYLRVLGTSLLNKIFSLKTEIQNGYLTRMKADERRYDKTGTLSRLTTNGDLALIKADEIGCGQNETSFGFICVYLRVLGTSLLKRVPSFGSIDLHPSLSKLNDVLSLAVSK